MVTFKYIAIKFIKLIIYQIVSFLKILLVLLRPTYVCMYIAMLILIYINGLKTVYSFSCRMVQNVYGEKY